MRKIVPLAIGILMAVATVASAKSVSWKTFTAKFISDCNVNHGDFSSSVGGALRCAYPGETVICTFSTCKLQFPK
jgi:hypothetical protein